MANPECPRTWAVVYSPWSKTGLSNSLFPAIPAKSRYPTADAL